MAQVDRIMLEELGVDLLQMMENAGRHLAAVAQKMLGGDASGRCILVLTGSGNNGRLSRFENNTWHVYPPEETPQLQGYLLACPLRDAIAGARAGTQRRAGFPRIEGIAARHELVGLTSLRCRFQNRFFQEGVHEIRAMQHRGRFQRRLCRHR